MSVVTELDPDEKEMALRAAERPKPLASSLVASGFRIRGKKLQRVGNKGSESWQEDAWDMYDLVGEERFLASTLANRVSQARFFVGKMPDDTTEDIEKVESGPAYDVFQTMSDRGKHFSQMVARMALNLFIPGDGYFVGIPKDLKKGGGSPSEQRKAEEALSPFGVAEDHDPLEDIDIDDLEWQMMSNDEVIIDDDRVEIKHGAKKKEFRIDDVVIIRVWRSHPRYWWQADSPTRSSLPVLRELVGLTMHISAQVDSRLAGAGVFLIPASADQALRAASDMSDDEKLSPFADALMEAMSTAIQDRSSAEAIVPIMPVVPDESIEKFRFIEFSTPLDTEARSLREESIRRLALGQDCPPELLLGVAGMNHWGAWLVREDVVTTHLEPPLALICDAITTQFLWPVLEMQGVQDFQDYVIWYDVDHLIMRPNRTGDAKDLHTAGVISDEALRDAAGFDEGDAPKADPNDPINTLILDMIREAPTLVQNPGLPVLAEQIRALVEGQTIPEGEPVEGGTEEAPEPTSEEAPAEEEGPPAEAPAVVASARARRNLGTQRCGNVTAHGQHTFRPTDDAFALCPGKL